MNFAEDRQKLKALEDLDDLHQEVRRTSHAISPILLKERGIKQLLEEFILKIEDNYSDLEIDYTIDCSDNFIPSPHQEILYFTALELINNALKHAQAKSLKILLKELESNYVLVVEDDGVGYDLSEINSKGIGIKSIQQRAEFLNGQFEIEKLVKGTKHVFTIHKKHFANQ